ncbi:nitrile hydratase subunit alpha [Poseidonocella sp. HB161398]|uniref:nitrile hydratase subunit alpha n=1 Tax=Poseidonocella sp. HB161398 TaxID=2320855 RepID=UPI001109B9BB|nr:nitrile hydratase subunit alpha [Poseidonocella sp. HB161398]
MPHDHATGHDHGHAPHPASRDHREPPAAFARLLDEVMDHLESAGILTRAEVTAQISDMETRTPENGARIVARCWSDPAFLARARKNLAAAAAELGIAMPSYPHFVLVENTPELHNVIVCTLCSCYPRAIMGPPPVWYKSRSYRSRVVTEPRAVLREFGTVLPEGQRVAVVDSTADCRYLVLPLRPAGTEGLTEGELAAHVTRDAMIGVTVL